MFVPLSSSSSNDEQQKDASSSWILPMRHRSTALQLQQQHQDQDHPMTDTAGLSALGRLREEMNETEDDGEQRTNEDSMIHWSFRSLDDPMESEVPSSSSSHHPLATTPCSPALLQKQFSWGFLQPATGASSPTQQRARGGITTPQQQQPPLSLVGAPHLPRSGDTDDSSAPWRLPTPCFSPLVGRTTLARVIAPGIRQMQRWDDEQPSRVAPPPPPNEEAADPPILPASPLFRTERSSNIVLAMRKQQQHGEYQSTHP